MDVIYTYKLRGAKPLIFWHCDKPDPYEEWYPEVMVATHQIVNCSDALLRKFRTYCQTTADRYGCYYDLLNATTLSFDRRQIVTIFKLYGKKPPRGVPCDLVQELVALLDRPHVRGGVSWIATMKKKLGLSRSS